MQGCLQRVPNPTHGGRLLLQCRAEVRHILTAGGGGKAHGPLFPPQHSKALHAWTTQTTLAGNRSTVLVGAGAPLGKDFKLMGPRHVGVVDPPQQPCSRRTAAFTAWQCMRLRMGQCQCSAPLNNTHATQHSSSRSQVQEVKLRIADTLLPVLHPCNHLVLALPYPSSHDMPQG